VEHEGGPVRPVCFERRAAGAGTRSSPGIKAAGYFRQQVQVEAGHRPENRVLRPPRCRWQQSPDEEVAYAVPHPRIPALLLPFALLLTGSFWAIQSLVQKTVRNSLRESLRQNHLSIARLRARSDLQNNLFLKVAGENASLKAGLQLLSDASGSSSGGAYGNSYGNQARRTVEDQLLELCERMGFDFLLVSDPGGKPLAGVLRSGDRVSALDAALMSAALMRGAREPVARHTGEC